MEYSDFDEYVNGLREQKDFRQICQTITKIAKAIDKEDGQECASDPGSVGEAAEALSMILNRPFPSEHPRQVEELQSVILSVFPKLEALKRIIEKEIATAKFTVVGNDGCCYLDEVLVTCKETSATNTEIRLCFKTDNATGPLEDETLEKSLGNATQAVCDLIERWLPRRPYCIGYEFSDIESRYVGPSAGLAAAVALMSCFSGLRCNSAYAFTGQVNIKGGLVPVSQERAKIEYVATLPISRFFVPFREIARQDEFSEKVQKILVRRETIFEVFDDVFADAQKGLRGLARLESSVRSKEKQMWSSNQYNQEPRTNTKHKNQPEHSNRVDSIHVHVDGGVDKGLVNTVINRLNTGKMRFGTCPPDRSKINEVVDFAKGPQRKNPVFKETYRYHTPVYDQAEKLEYFSTTPFGRYWETKAKIKQLLTELADRRGIVVEVERIIAIVDKAGHTHLADTDFRQYPTIDSSDVGFLKGDTAPIEVHFACDIARVGQWRDNPPFGRWRGKEPGDKLEVLSDMCSEIGFEVGGWFLFDKDSRKQDRWAYRSNMFAYEVDLSLIKAQRDELFRKLKERGIHAEVSATVENILGVWKAPFDKCAEQKSVQQLAAWEKFYPSLKEFWVVAPNFLGDIEKDINDAMVHNLENGVKYVYCVRSFADYQRLKYFVASLTQKMELRKGVDDLIQAFLIQPGTFGETVDRVLDNHYFIVNPQSHRRGISDADGYRLAFSDQTKEFRGAYAISRDEIAEVVSALQPIINSKSKTTGIRLPLQLSMPKPTNTVIVLAELEGTIKRRKELGEERWCALWEEYDTTIGRKVSEGGGRVIKGFEGLYLLEFDRPGSALVSIKKIQDELGQHNCLLDCLEEQLSIRHKAIMDFGQIHRVIRAYGPDMTSRHLAHSLWLLKNTEYGEILITKSFVEAAEDSLGKSHFLEYGAVPAGKRFISESGEESWDVWRLDLNQTADSVNTVTKTQEIAN